MLQKIKVNAKTTLKDLKKHKWQYLYTGVLIQLLFGVIGSFILRRLFGFTLLLTGQDNLNNTNLTQILFNPLGLISLIVYLILLVILLFLEYQVFCLIIVATKENRKIAWRELFQPRKVKMNRANFINACFFLLYVLLTVPIANFGLSTTLTNHLYIPDFITGEWSKSPTSAMMMLVAGAIMIYLAFRFLFVVPLFTLTDTNFPQIFKQSWQLTKGRIIEFLLSFTVVEFVLGLLLVPIYMVIMIIAVLLDMNGTNLFLEGLMLTLLNSTVFVLNLFVKIGIFHLLIQKLPQVSENLPLRPLTTTRKKSSIVLMVLAFGGFYVGQTYQLAILVYNPEMVIVGHRGYVTDAVENSVEGLKAAKKHHADYVELDLLYTKDHQFVVMHDNNLKRLAGVNQKVDEMQAKDVIGLKIRQDGHESKIVSMTDYLKVAKQLKMKLILELKPTGKEDASYVPKFVQELKKSGLANQVKIMSLDLPTMRKVEKLAPSLDTGYVIPIQFGHLPNEPVDFYAIEDFSYRPHLAYEVHALKKQLFVWTINSPDKIRHYLQTPIDGLITDELDTTNQTKKELSKEKSYLDRLVDLIQPIQ